MLIGTKNNSIVNKCANLHIIHQYHTDIYINMTLVEAERIGVFTGCIPSP